MRRQLEEIWSQSGHRPRLLPQACKPAPSTETGRPCLCSPVHRQPAAGRWRAALQPHHQPGFK
jgi:hypothetical protein